ncbi:hypothetical protein [Mosqueiro virus]|uniref:Uncharacterized protein n=1 Tax=Mosqueiro virus TaxID=200403 RepID=A0A0D3R1Y1_9RHAB|nr:hypothetical protein [Mosqueiro virus]AJR28522.1 hypothetical protein [Mosqueiro virus]
MILQIQLSIHVDVPAGKYDARYARRLAFYLVNRVAQENNIPRDIAGIAVSFLMSQVSLIHTSTDFDYLCGSIDVNLDIPSNARAQVPCLRELITINSPVFIGDETIHPTLWGSISYPALGTGVRPWEAWYTDRRCFIPSNLRLEIEDLAYDFKFEYILD